MTDREREIVRRLADGEDPGVIDPEYGCTNPLTGYFPTAEVETELERRRNAAAPTETTLSSSPEEGWRATGPTGYRLGNVIVAPDGTLRFKPYTEEIIPNDA